jgi:hypothetical protein
MNPTRPTPRRNLIDFSLLYVFSYDVELSLAREVFNNVSGGVRLNLRSRPELSSVYHVSRERTAPGLGFRAVAGSLTFGADAVSLRDDDVARSDIQVSILTEDGHTIHVSYAVVGYLGPGGVRRISDGKGKDRLGTEDDPFEAPIVSSPRFQTASPKYFWMNEHQGVGFGRVQIVKSQFRRITADIYVMT